MTWASGVINKTELLIKQSPQNIGATPPPLPQSPFPPVHVGTTGVRAQCGRAGKETKQVMEDSYSTVHEKGQLKTCFSLSLTDSLEENWVHPVCKTHPVRTPFSHATRGNRLHPMDHIIARQPCPHRDQA